MSVYAGEFVALNDEHGPVMKEIQIQERKVMVVDVVQKVNGIGSLVTQIQ